MPKILLIEDEPDINLLARTALKVKGFDVVWAENGKDGIEKAREGNLDLILLDISMPELNGYDVIKILKEDRNTQEIMVVFFSAHAQKNEVQKGIALGAVGYIDKPFDPETLPDEVTSFLNQGKMEHDKVLKKDSVHDELLMKYTGLLLDKLKSIYEAVKNEDYESTSLLGHRLAGSGASYGFPKLSEIGLSIEYSADNKDVETLQVLLKDLEKEISIITRNQRN